MINYFYSRKIYFHRIYVHLFFCTFHKMSSMQCKVLKYKKIKGTENFMKYITKTLHKKINGQKSITCHIKFNLAERKKMFSKKIHSIIMSTIEIDQINFIPVFDCFS